MISEESHAWLRVPPTALGELPSVRLFVLSPARSDFQDLAAALRGEQRKEEPLPSKNQWESGSARVPEQRLRKLLVEAQHPEVSRVKGCAYIALTEFVKVVGAVPLPILDEAKAAKKRKVEAPKVAAGGQGGGGGGKGKGGQAPDVWQHCERSSARERQSSAARTWVQKYWARQKNAAMTENPARVKAEEDARADYRRLQEACLLEPSSAFQCLPEPSSAFQSLLSVLSLLQPPRS